MAQMSYIKPKIVSSKANNLAILEEVGVRVPPFKMFNITEEYREDFEDNFGLFVRAFLNPYYEGKYAVRSSGSVSTPGRMKTVLNVDFSDLVDAGVKVFESTKTQRLQKYLELKGVEDFSAAIVVQQMVDPTFNRYSCSGVLTTCHPITGKTGEYGEVVFGKVGESIMSGKNNPTSLKALENNNQIGYVDLLQEVWKIRQHFDKPQEVEFVVEDTIAWIVQTRDYKKVSPIAIDFDGYEIIGKGRPATPIAAIGTVTHDKSKITEDSIYVSETTDWEDTEAILKGKGVITLKGGSLSHAAIIAREFELPCVTGAELAEDFEEGLKIGISTHGLIYKL